MGKAGRGYGKDLWSRHSRLLKLFDQLQLKFQHAHTARRANLQGTRHGTRHCGRPPHTHTHRQWQGMGAGHGTWTRTRTRTGTAAVAQIMRRFVGSHEQAIWTWRERVGPGAGGGGQGTASVAGAGGGGCRRRRRRYM